MSIREKRKEINKVARKIASKFHPEKIYLFGSYAYGKPHADSDVDLFVVKKTSNPRQLAGKIDSLFFPNRPFAMDILVRTPDHVEERLWLGDPFVKKIIQDGQLLYTEGVK